MPTITIEFQRVRTVTETAIVDVEVTAEALANLRDEARINLWAEYTIAPTVKTWKQVSAGVLSGPEPTNIIMPEPEAA